MIQELDLSHGHVSKLGMCNIAEVFSVMFVSPRTYIFIGFLLKTLHLMNRLAEGDEERGQVVYVEVVGKHSWQPAH